jgi:hypothetical protein
MARPGIAQHNPDRSPARGPAKITLGGKRYDEFIEGKNRD